MRSCPDTLRVGLVGCGYWGRNLLRVLWQIEGVEVALVADASPAALEQIPTLYKGLRTATSDTDVLDERSIDAVVIATQAGDHYRAAKQALLAGKHAFVEKPLALAVDQAEELVELAEVRGLTLMAGHTFLYNSAVHKVKELIDSGALGDIYYIYGRRLNLGVVRSDVNVLWNLAPHDVSIILYWTGDQPVASTASGGTFLQPEVEDVAFLHMVFPEGLVANVHLSWLDPHKTRELTVVGSKKMATFDDVSTDAKVTVFDMGIDVSERAVQGTSYDSFGEFQLLHRYGDIVVPRIDYPEPLLEEMKHFVQCVRTGEPPLSGGDHAVAVVKVLEEANRSLKVNTAKLSTPHGRLRTQTSVPGGADG